MSGSDRANFADVPPATSAATPTAPPAPPRDLTPAASRRAWHEPRVHFWWIVALVLIAVAVCLGVQQAWDWSSEVRLIRNGTRVDAIVWHVGGQMKGRLIEEGQPVQIIFPFNDQEISITDSEFAGRTKGMTTGTAIPIFVDPQDPQRYTARSAPQPLLRQLIGPLMLASVAAVLIVSSVLKRRAVLAIWTRGDARPAAVVETKQTALAPRSRLVRCVLTNEADRRLIDVYVPHRAATFQPGDPIWLIMPPGRPDKALAAVSFRA